MKTENQLEVWPRAKDAEEGSCSGRRRTRFSICGIAFIVFLVALVGLAVILSLHFVVFRKDQYGIVFDGGSSHTDMSLFRWPGEKIEETGVVVEVTKCDVAGVGISSYNNTPAEAGKSIEKCLSEAKRKIPEDRIKSTPIFMGATAGMRLLNIDNQTKSDAVIESIEDKFEESGFKYEPGNVQIINGVQEGISAWISANLLLGNLGQNGTKEETVGTLDLGGASTQISFETTDRAEGAKDEDYETLRLYGFDFPVFAHTYLCFGLNEVTSRFKAELVKAAPEGEININNPCFHDGYKEDVLLTDLFNMTCTPVAPPNKPGSTVYKFRGTGESDHCVKKVLDLLNATMCRKNKHKECLDETVVPDIPADKKFVAISGYYHTAKFFDALHTTPDGFKKKTVDYCALNWNEVSKRTDVKEEFLSRNCFAGHYVHLILTQMYDFNTEEKWKLIDFSKSIAGVSSGWTLGFMTNATNALPVEAIRAINPQVFISLLIVFLILILIAAVAVVGYWAYARSRSRSPTFN